MGFRNQVWSRSLAREADRKRSSMRILHARRQMADL
jgi:hypothetical protein